MEPLGRLLRRRPGNDGASFVAAMVVETCNSVIHDLLHLTEADARATSFRDGVIRAVVSHGAVAGLLQQRSTEICAEIDARLAKHGPAQNVVKRITTRLS